MSYYRDILAHGAGIRSGLAACTHRHYAEKVDDSDTSEKTVYLLRVG